MGYWPFTMVTLRGSGDGANVSLYNFIFPIFEKGIHFFETNTMIRSIIINLIFKCVFPAK